MLSAVISSSALLEESAAAVWKDDGDEDVNDRATDRLERFDILQWSAARETRRVVSLPDARWMEV